MPRNIDIFSLKVDYVKPISDKSNFEAGIKTGKTFTDNEIHYENRYDGEWVEDHNQSNHFKYTEGVSAVYATYSQMFGKFSAMAGLRAEYTSIKGESPTMDTTFTRSYLGWFPSTYLQYKINDKQALNLSYTRKINRPGFGKLNPFRRYDDPYTFLSGNPDLNPEYYNTIALRFNIGGGYSVNANYSIVNGVSEREFVQDDTNNVTNITFKNVGKRQVLYLSGFAPVQLSKWYTLRINAEAMYSMVDARFNGEPFKKNYLAIYVAPQHVFTILPTLRANMQMSWTKSGWYGIIKVDDVWDMNAQIEKTFLDKRLSVTLSCNDIFSSNNFSGKIKFDNIDQTVKEYSYGRRMMLNVRYSFGSQKIRAARNRSVGIEDEMGRTQ